VLEGSRHRSVIIEDIEIKCPTEAIAREYRQGRVFIKTILNHAEASPKYSGLSS
jgi:hypothetical protein